MKASSAIVSTEIGLMKMFGIEGRTVWGEWLNAYRDDFSIPEEIRSVVSVTSNRSIFWQDYEPSILTLSMHMSKGLGCKSMAAWFSGLSGINHTPEYIELELCDRSNLQKRKALTDELSQAVIYAFLYYFCHGLHLEELHSE